MAIYPIIGIKGKWHKNGTILDQGFKIQALKKPLIINKSRIFKSPLIACILIVYNYLLLFVENYIFYFNKNLLN